MNGFYLYRRGIRVRNIAKVLNISEIYPDGKQIKRRGKFERPVNWGCVRYATPENALNHDLSICASKVLSYRAFSVAGIPCPHMFSDAIAAKNSGRAFLGRKDYLSEGRGIRIYNAGDTPQEHDFYTAIIPCLREYRLHIFNDAVILVQKKLLKNATNIIHSYENGVVFCTQTWEHFRAKIGSKTADRAANLAIKAVRALGLDFAAVDILQDHDRKLYVLEANSAPGIVSESTEKAWLGAFSRLVVQ